VHSQLAGNVSNRSPLHITTVTVPAVQHYHPWLVPNYTGWLVTEAQDVKTTVEIYRFREFEWNGQESNVQRNNE